MKKKHFEDKGIPLFQIQNNYPTSKAIQLHPDLIPYLKTINPPRINKESREALLLYNYYIAQDLYDLNITFEKNNAIIPTPLLRYNFLQQVITKNSTILEIGTGASAIIALLAASQFNAQVYATEIDEEYIILAKENIAQNKLSEKISVINSKGKIIDGIFQSDFSVDFIISNPPYYDKILSPKFLWGGKSHELISEGKSGEKFIIQLIKEGWKYLNVPGILSFIIPKTRHDTLVAIEQFLNENEFEYDIIGLLAGNRTRYVFKIYKKYMKDELISSEMI